MADLIPRTELKSGQTISFESNDYLEIYRTFRVMLGLAGSLD